MIEFLGNDVIVGFNVSFDMRFLQTRLGKGIKNPAFDVLSFVKETEPNLPHYKLDNLRRHFHVGGIPHTALGDCMATAEIFQKCLVAPEGIRFREQALEMQSINDQEAEVERERHQRIMDRNNEQPKSRRLKFHFTICLTMMTKEMKYLTHGLLTFLEFHTFTTVVIHVKSFQL